MSRGGPRKGAGRPKGTGKYGEKTIPLRVPTSLVDAVNALIENDGYEIPLFSSKVSAGLPDMASDHFDQTINLAAHMVRSPKDTFCVSVQGESMINAGISPDDILVVDKKLEPRNGKIIVAAVDGELTVKRLKTEDGRITLMPENDSFQPLLIEDSMQFDILGIVTNVVKAV